MESKQKITSIIYLAVFLTAKTYSQTANGPPAVVSPIIVDPLAPVASQPSVVPTLPVAVVPAAPQPTTVELVPAPVSGDGPINPQASVAPVVIDPLVPVGFPTVSPSGPVDPSAPVSPTVMVPQVPVDPQIAVDPQVPVGPSAPVDPPAPTDPIAAVVTVLLDPPVSVAPTSVQGSVDPQVPVDPLVPVNPTPLSPPIPVDPLAPASPQAPLAPIDPLVPVNQTPVDPLSPASPQAPVAPQAPIDPLVPLNPTPVDPQIPVDPLSTASPQSPVNPQVPVDPIAPVNPTPVDPQSPVDPLIPVNPVAPVDPQVAVNPQAPVDPQTIADILSSVVTEPTPESETPVEIPVETVTVDDQHSVDTGLNAADQATTDSPGSDGDSSPVETQTSTSIEDSGETTTSADFTTTTVSPVTIDPNRFVSTDNCAGCVFTNQRCSMPNATDCNGYIECFYEGASLRAVRRHCAFGLMWDRETGVCQYASQVTCLQDRCQNLATVSYPYNRNCRAYWSCVNGNSVAACCDKGQAYVYGQGCVDDNTCNQVCRSIVDVIPNSKPACSLLAHETDPTMFKQFEFVGRWTDKHCGPNTVFSQRLCVCVASGRPASPKCSPQMVFDFEGDYSDKSGKGTFPGKQNLELENGALKLSGNSKITFWLFSGYYFGKEITLKLRFRENDASQGGVESLVSNCGWSQAPSIDVTIVRETGVKMVFFTLDTDKQVSMTVSLPYVAGEWNDVTLVYDSATMTATVNSETVTKALDGGNVAQRSANLYIGQCGQGGGFRGYIDDLEFYKCANV